MLELKTNEQVPASGVVIESKIDKNKGAVITVIVQRGILRKSDIMVAGSSFGRVKKMVNHQGNDVEQLRPSEAAEIYGLNNPPVAGDIFNIVDSDKQAKDITDYRIRKQKKSKVTASKTSLEELFKKASNNIGTVELPIIIKADVNGSVEAIIGSLNKIQSEEVKLKILHSGVGGISESDVALAEASKAMILGFNVRTAFTSSSLEFEKIDIRYYSIIYNLIDDIKEVMSGMLTPNIRESYIGSVEIREVFNISKVGKIAGSYVTKGNIKKGASVRLIRDNIVIYEGKLKTLRRFKDDVKEVKEGFECGIAFENYEDIKISDKVEVYELIEEKRHL